MKRIIGRDDLRGENYELIEMLSNYVLGIVNIYIFYYYFRIILSDTRSRKVRIRTRP